MLVAVFLAVLCNHHWRFGLNQYAVWIAGFSLFAAMSIFWAEHRSFAVGMTKTLFFNIACMLSYMYLMNCKRSRTRMVKHCLIIAPLLLEIRIVMTGGLLAFLNSRALGGISANMVGLCATYGACLAFCFALEGKHKKFYGALALFNVFIVVLSASRKALLCLGIVIAIFYLFEKGISLRKRAVRLLALFLLLIVALVAIMKIPFLYNLVGNRIEGMLATFTGNEEAADASSHSRFVLIQWGMEWFRNKPWLGHGIDGFRAILVQEHPSWPITYYAHNNYVELLVDVGIVGTVLYYWLHVSMLFKGIRHYRRLTNSELVICSILASIVISEYALVSYYDKYFQMLLLILWFQTRAFWKKDIDYSNN